MAVLQTKAGIGILELQLLAVFVPVASAVWSHRDQISTFFTSRGGAEILGMAGPRKAVGSEGGIFDHAGMGGVETAYPTDVPTDERPAGGGRRA